MTQFERTSINYVEKGKESKCALRPDAPPPWRTNANVSSKPTSNQKTATKNVPINNLASATGGLPSSVATKHTSRPRAEGGEKDGAQQRHHPDHFFVVRPG